MTLDKAWEAAEEALPKIREFDRGKRVPDDRVKERWSLTVERWGNAQYSASAEDPTEDADRQSWLGLTATGHGKTPAAALRDLTTKLRKSGKSPRVGG